MDKLKEFYKFMLDYTAFFEGLLDDEKQKLEAVLSYNLKELEQSVSMQQAAVMKLESMEKRREELQNQAGYEGKTFKEILADVDEESSKALGDVFHRLEDAISMIKFYNQKSMDVVKLNLNTINDSTSAETQGYTNKGHSGGYMGSSVFETKI